MAYLLQANKLCIHALITRIIIITEAPPPLATKHGRNAWKHGKPYLISIIIAKTSQWG
jgi:hypothetical protein